MTTLSRVLTCLVFTLLSTLVVAQDIPTKFDPQRDAVKDMMAAQNLAKATGKHLLVDVGGEWCSWCRMLDRFIASQPQIKALIDSQYVWVKVNYSPENKNTAVLSRWPKAHGYPYLLVLDGAGRLLRAQGVQGLEIETEIEGDENYDPDRVVAFLNRYATATKVPAESHLAFHWFKN